MNLKHATLTFFVDKTQQRVLLGMKRRGFGTGKWNGYGGKILYDETPIQAAIRETKEECGIEVLPKHLRKMGELTFLMPHHAMGTQLVHVYVCDQWKGEPIESDEMTPHWYSLDQLPLHQMWEDDKYWLPHILSGKPVTATLLFNNDNETLKAKEIHYLKDADEFQLPSVYFSASIAGGRDHAHFYPAIVKAIKKHAHVLTEHFADPTLLTEREEGKTDEFLYWRDIAWIETCDWFIADVTQPSLGVGYEIALAEHLHKKIVCMYYKKGVRQLTAMVRGNHRLPIIDYEDPADAEQQLLAMLEQWKKEHESQKQ